jgi:hypothetical protein
MKAILIDPKAKTITIIDIKFGLKPIYDLLKCSCFTCPVTYPNLDTLYVDDESWLTYDKTTKPAGFTFPDWSYPILGRGLIMGENEEGGSIDVKSTPADFLRDIIWMSPEEMYSHGISAGIIDD